MKPCKKGSRILSILLTLFMLSACIAVGSMAVSAADPEVTAVDEEFNLSSFKSAVNKSARQVYFGTGTEYATEIEGCTVDPVSISTDGNIVVYRNNYVYYVVNKTDGKIVAPSSLASMFYSYSSLTTVVFGENFDTSSVTNMSSMFYNCYGFTSIDLSNFKTSNVTSMSYMFYYCYGLAKLDLSGFNTSSVTNMAYMFSYCSGLTGLDLTDFDTSNVTNMHQMFYRCSGLTGLDLSGFNTSSVTDMAYMFSDCSKLEELDLTKFNTSNVLYMNSMFKNCGNLKTVSLTSFDTSKVTNMSYMFNGCSKLTETEISHFVTTSLTDMNRMFENCSSLKSIDLSGFNTSAVTGNGMVALFNGCTDLDTVALGDNFTTAGITSLSYFFGNCKNLTDENLNEILKKFDTSNVNDMSYMFYACTGLKNPDFSVIATLNVKNMNNMFCSCTGLESINLSLDTSGATNMSYMFAGCTGLKNAEFDKSFKTGAGCTTEFMFYNCLNIESVDFKDGNMSNVTKMGNMFKSCNSLTSVRFGENFKTGANCSMTNMFLSCTKLENVDFTGADMSGVTDMSYMFSGCTGLKSCPKTDDNFVTGANCSMAYMFNCCSGLTEIDLSELNTVNVTNMEGLFQSCGSLADIKFVNEDGSTKFDTSKVTNMKNMFKFCSGLKAIDLSNFNTSKVANMEYMFSGCSGLTGLDLSGFDTSSVTLMSYMFNGCSSLKNLNLKGFNTSNVTHMLYMFCGCSGLTNIDLSSFRTPKLKYMYNMFEGCSGLKSLNLSGFDTSNIDNMSYMFNRCSGLTNLNLTGFNTTNVKYMESMFKGCSGLTSIDLSSFRTSNVRYMDDMFSGCTGLKYLDISSWGKVSVNNSSCMFYNCTKLQRIYANDGSTYSFYGFKMFTNCITLKGGNGESYEYNYYDYYSAHIDSAEKPGYFTSSTMMDLDAMKDVQYLTSITLKGRIDINIKMTDFGVCFDEDKLTVLIDDVEKEFNCTKDSDGNIVVSLVAKSVPLAEVGNNVIIKIRYNGKTIESITGVKQGSYRASVAKYCNYLINGDYNELDKELCRKILLCGAYAQKVFDDDVKEEDLVTTIDPEEDFNDFTFADDIEIGEKCEEADNYFSEIGYKLGLNGDISLIFEYETKEDVSVSASQIKIYNSADEKIKAYNVDFDSENNTITVGSIDSSRIGETYRLYIKDGLVDVATDSPCVICSPYGCLKATVESSNVSEDMKNLCKAVYLYGVASNNCIQGGNV